MTKTPPQPFPVRKPKPKPKPRPSRVAEPLPVGGTTDTSLDAYAGIVRVALEISEQEAQQRRFIKQALIAGNEAAALQCVRRLVGVGEECTGELGCCGSCPALTSRKGSIDDFIGCLSDPKGPKLTIGEISESTERGGAGEKA